MLKRWDLLIAFSTLADLFIQFLSSDTEVLYNSLWRFLAVRDYVDTKHNLTNWGKMLVAVIAALDGKPQLEEAAFLAVELLRLDMLNGDKAMCAPYFGSPFRGDGGFDCNVSISSRANDLQSLTKNTASWFPNWLVWVSSITIRLDSLVLSASICRDTTQSSMLCVVQLVTLSKSVLLRCFSRTG